MGIFRYWGKADPVIGGWHLLPYHSLDVAACAVTLLKARPDWQRRLIKLTGLTGEHLEQWVGFFAALHDLGKFASAFQGQVPHIAQALGQTRHPPYTVRHDSLGWMMWRFSLARKFTSDAHRASCAVWVRAATGHHGQPPTLASLTDINTHALPEDLTATEDWVRLCHERFCVDLSLGAEADFERASWWLAGLFTVADWLGSDAEKFPYCAEPVDLDEYWEKVQTQANYAVADAGLGFIDQERFSFRDLFPAYTPSAVQALADNLATSEAHLTIIEESTGSGKTEAALALAGGQHLFFGLPTQATANGLWARIRNSPILSRQATLSHGGRWLVPGSMEYATAWLRDSTRRSLLSDVCVGTVDQALLCVLYTRHAALRLIGLMAKSIIVDEAHAYDPYQRAILSSLIERAAQSDSSVILLSATLPKSHRQQYVDAWARGRSTQRPPVTSDAYPLITHVRSEEDIREITLASAPLDRTIAFTHLSDVTEVERRIVNAAQSGQCVCWIRNTVRDAIEVYDRLRLRAPKVTLFHARFIGADRARIEQQVLSRFGKISTCGERGGQVLIATQVVEQSLDLDFDLLATDIAPIDLVIQRVGRLHRHDRGDRGMPEVILHAPRWQDVPGEGWMWGWGKGTAVVYPDHGRLWLTLGALRRVGRLVLPRDARDLVEGVYGPDIEQTIPMPLRQTTVDATDKALSMVNTAGFHTVTGAYEADGTTRWDDERAPTRLGAPVREWVLSSEGKLLAASTFESSVKLYVSSLAEASPDRGIRVAPWQRSLAMAVDGTGWTARGSKLDRKPVTVRYSRDRGFTVE